MDYVYYGFFHFNYFYNLANQLGLFVILSFLLVFSVVYAILLRIGLFKQVPAASVIVSLVIAFFALTNYYIAIFMANLFSKVVIAIIVFLAIIILLALFNIDVSQGKYSSFFIGVAIIAIIIILIKAFSQTYNLGIETYLWHYLSYYFPLIIIIIGVILIVLFTPAKENEPSLAEKILLKKH